MHGRRPRALHFPAKARFCRGIAGLRLHFPAKARFRWEIRGAAQGADTYLSSAAESAANVAKLRGSLSREGGEVVGHVSG
jgi:hypothetical protein